jgi:hypothetical protein
MMALEQAKAVPTVRPVDPAKLKRRSPFFKSDDGVAFTVPEDEREDQPADVSSVEARQDAQQVKEVSAHLEMQWLLAKLGNDMGWAFGLRETIEVALSMVTPLHRLLTWYWGL